MARAGSFANPKIIDLLNRSSVPLFLDYDRFIFNGDPGWKLDPRGLDELKRLREIEIGAGVPYNQGFRPVHITVFSPDLEVMDSLPIGRLLNQDEVLAALQKCTQDLAVKPGEPLFPRPGPETLKRNPDDLVLLIVSHFLLKPEEVPVYDAMLTNLGQKPAGWHDPPPSMLGNRVLAPGKDYPVLTRAQWEPLVRSKADPQARSWNVEDEAAANLLCRLRVPCEIFRVDPTRLDIRVLRAEVLREDAGTRTVRLQAEHALRQPWWDPKDDERVTGTFTGYLTYDKAADRITSFEMASQGARYRGGLVRPVLDIPVGIGVTGPAK